MSVIATERLLNPGQPELEVYLINRSFSDTCQGDYEFRVERGGPNHSERDGTFLLGPREEEQLLTYSPGELKWRVTFGRQECRKANAHK